MNRNRLFAAVLAGAAASLAMAPLTQAEARGRAKVERKAFGKTAAVAAKGSGQKWSRHSGSSRYGQASSRHGTKARAVEPAVAISKPSEPSRQVAVPAAQPAVTTGPTLVGIAAGGVTSTSARVASDLSAVLDSSGLRVLPLMTRSSLSDALALALADKSDLVFLHADVVDGLPEAQRAAMTSRIAYVARLYNDEVHVVASRAVKDIHDLSGKTVNVGLEGSANAQTAELMFDKLGIAAKFVHLDQPTALTKLADGDLAADVLVSGRPVKALQDFAGDGRFQLLAVPYDAALQDTYLPAKIEAADYGNLVPSGAGIETLAVPIVLATIDAPAGSARAARVDRFTQAFFQRFDALRDPSHHPKWRDVNLAASIPNWTRFAAAQEAIDRSTARSVAIDKAPQP